METFEVSSHELMADGAKPSFSGEVTDRDLSKLLRFFSLTSKTGRLTLAAPPERELWLVDGVPRHARADALAGREAIASLVADPGTTFRFHEGERLEDAKWTIAGDRIALLRDLLGITDLSDLGIDAADLAKAERLQRHLLARLPAIPGYDIGVVYEGRSGVSGDFYDVGIMPSGDVLVVLGDVAGHGVQAALEVASMLKSLRALRRQDHELGELLGLLNDDLRQELLPGQFMTVFAALLTPATGEVTMALAGHHPALRFPLAGAATTEALGKRGPALGLFPSERFVPMLQLTTLRLERGQGLLQFTDGILEAMDAKSEEFGDERLAASLGRHRACTAQQLVDAISADTKAFATTIEDDVTVLAVVRKADAPDGQPTARSGPVSTDAHARRNGPPSTDFGIIVPRLDGPAPAVTAAVRAANSSTGTAPRPAPEPERADAAGGDPWLGRMFGQVKTVCRISQGSMGAVYRGHHEVLALDVAVKVMLHRGTDARAELHRQRFLREARAAARIRHNHVVQIIDAGQTAEGEPFLVMELVEGPSLARRLDEHGRMGAVELAQLGKGIAEGLAAIHRQGIAHRDIKPDNILIDPMGQAKISDLGLARLVDEGEAGGLTKTGIVVGTPAYISPEAIRDSSTAGPPSDIYSLGVTFYHLLAGRPPYEGKVISELMRAHLLGKFTPLRTLVPGLDPALCALVERCLKVDAEERPTADQLAQGLGGLATSGAGGFVASQATIVPQLFRKQKQRQQRGLLADRRLWIGLIIAGAVIGLLAVLVANRHWFI